MMFISKEDYAAMCRDMVKLRLEIERLTGEITELRKEILTKEITELRKEILTKEIEELRRR